MRFSAKQWADAFMAPNADQLHAMIIKAGVEPDWREVFLSWLDTCQCADVYFTMLVAAKFGLLPVISTAASGER